MKILPREQWVGIVSNCENNIRIEECYNYGNITGSVVSGIAVNGNYINKCINFGKITGSRHAGGIFGDYSSRGNIYNCYNVGDIYNTGGYAGGISTQSENVINCYNTGRIESSLTGGITAYGSVLNCFNSGNINSTGSGPTSGISAQGSSAENCYNIGDAKGDVAAGIMGMGNSQRIYKCFNAGNITAKTAPTGGILGVGYGATCTECYNTGNVANETPDLLGEIAPVSFGTTVNCAFLQKETNAPANGATPKSKEEMDKIMDMQKFVDLLNQKVQEYNNNPENTTKLKSWKLENGKPVFAE